MHKDAEQCAATAREEGSRSASTKIRYRCELRYLAKSERWSPNNLNEHALNDQNLVWLTGNGGRVKPAIPRSVIPDLLAPVHAQHGHLARRGSKDGPTLEGNSTGLTLVTTPRTNVIS